MLFGTVVLLSAIGRDEKREARRHAIARAAWAVLMRDGVRGASVRAVLAEANMTSGAMRYYFSNHDELLIFAAEHVLEQARARIERHLADDRLTGRERVRAILGEILPLDDTRAMEITVFARLAEIDDDGQRGAHARAEAYHGCRRLAEMTVEYFEQTSSRTGAPASSTERQHRAERLHLALDGLAYQCVLYPGLISYRDVAVSLDRLLDHLETEIHNPPPR